MGSNQPRRISRRIGDIAGSATMAVDARAKELKARGRPVIGFGTGEPDFATPAHIVSAAAEACSDPRQHRYSPAAGQPELRAAIARQSTESTGLATTPHQVLVTNGGKQAVYQAFATLIDPGDKVLVPAPYWTTYPEAIRLAGAEPVPVLATADQGYLPTLEQLEAARTPQTKVLVWCSPSNPTGAVASEELTKAVGRWALEHGLWVVTDEIYRHLVYDGARGVPILNAVPELADQCVVLDGVAKTFAMTGWRVGWMVGPEDVVTAASNLQSHLTSNVSNVSQRAALAALNGPFDAVEKMRAAFDQRRRRMVELLNAIDRVHCPAPRGAFYCFPDVTALVGATVAGTTVSSSAKLAEVVLTRAEVAVVPGEAFGAPGYLRLSYALNDADLETGLTRIAELLAH